jgi:NAD(P)-dependent dehydrogenase (short-subunit alcohol dehydrogenase family)
MHLPMLSQEKPKRGHGMRAKQVWFITGAGRGLGVDIAKAALAAGHAVVATGRDTRAVEKALGKSDNLLAVKLDVTRLADAEAAVRAAVERFGHIDVLVNNAGNFYAGFFEELSPEDIEKQLAVNLFGPMNVTRAVLPVMRKQRSGHVVTLSSSAGVVGQEFASAYCTAKFGVEGWMESLAPEVAPFGIHTTLVNPGVFRTQLLSEESMAFASLSIPDYKERRAKHQAGWTSFHGQQPGDPAKLAQALVTVARQEKPPRRFVAGADAVQAVKQKGLDLQAQSEATLDLSMSLAHDPPRS